MLKRTRHYNAFITIIQFCLLLVMMIWGYYGALTAFSNSWVIFPDHTRLIQLFLYWIVHSWGIGLIAVAVVVLLGRSNPYIRPAAISATVLAAVFWYASYLKGIGFLGCTLAFIGFDSRLFSQQLIALPEIIFLVFCLESFLRLGKHESIIFFFGVAVVLLFEAWLRLQLIDGTYEILPFLFKLMGVYCLWQQFNPSQNRMKSLRAEQGAKNVVPSSEVTKGN